MVEGLKINLGSKIWKVNEGKIIDKNNIFIRIIVFLFFVIGRFPSVCVWDLYFFIQIFLLFLWSLFPVHWYLHLVFYYRYAGSLSLSASHWFTSKTIKKKYFAVGFISQILTEVDFRQEKVVSKWTHTILNCCVFLLRDFLSETGI